MSAGIGRLSLLLFVVSPCAVIALKCYTGFESNHITMGPAVACESGETYCFSFAAEKDKDKESRGQLRGCSSDCAATEKEIKALLDPDARNIKFVCCKGDLCNLVKV